MRFLKLTGLATVLALALASQIADAQQSKSEGSQLRSGLSRWVSPSESELSRSRADVIQKIKETRAGAERLLSLHEVERQRRAEEFELRRKLYQRGLSARNDVVQAENALGEAMLRVTEDKHWLAQTDMLITEVTMRNELLRLSRLAIGA